MIKVENLKDSDLVCYCIEVKKKTIVKAIKDGNTTLQSIKENTGACTGSECKVKNPSRKCCSKDIKGLIKIYTNTNDTSSCGCC